MGRLLGGFMRSFLRRYGIGFFFGQAFLVTPAAILLLFGALFASGAALADCPMSPGTGADILINGVCHVGDGTYTYGNVNIIAGGKLVFDETIPKVNINFWAKGILIENGGILTAGSPAAPFGSMGGTLTIHLYGKDGLKPPAHPGHDPWTFNTGIQCKSPLNGTAPCGIPSTDGNDPWNKGSTTAYTMPGGNLDYFYKYDAMPFDTGVDPTTETVGYFGVKVLAVSYGGTLNLYGKKGALYGAQEPTDPKSSGASWVRTRRHDPGKGHGGHGRDIAHSVRSG